MAESTTLSEFVKARLVGGALTPPISWLWGVINKMRRPQLYVGDQTLMTRTVFGQVMFLDAGDTSLTLDLLLRGYWEPDVTRLFRRQLRPGMRVVEIGANLGYYTLQAAQIVGPSGAVIAFEPNPRVAALLRRSLRANGTFGLVRVMEMAVADASGERTLHVRRHRHGDSSLFRPQAAHLAQTGDEVSPVIVPATSLDVFFADDPAPIDLVKMDVEGAEPTVFDGMQQLLARQRSLRMLIEFIPGCLENEGCDPGAFLETIRALGFTIHAIGRHGQTRAVTTASLLATPASELLLTR